MNILLGIQIITVGREAALRTWLFLNFIYALAELYLAHLLLLSGDIIFTAVTGFSVAGEMRVSYFYFSYP